MRFPASAITGRGEGNCRRLQGALYAIFRRQSALGPVAWQSARLRSIRENKPSLLYQYIRLYFDVFTKLVEEFKYVPVDFLLRHDTGNIFSNDHDRWF